MAKTRRYNSGPSAEELKKQWGSDSSGTKQQTRSAKDIKSQWDGTAEKDRQTEQVRLKRQKAELDSFSGPQYQGAAQRAAYYQRELGYNAKYGDRAAYDASYAAYQDALRQANSAYRAEEALRQSRNYMQDMMRGANPFRALTATRSAREDAEIQAGRAGWYGQMAQDAAAIGSQELFNLAQSGLEKTGRSYEDAYRRYLEASESGQRAQAEQFKANNRGEYFGATLSREQIEGQLRQLEQRKAKAEQELATAYDAWRVGSQNGEEEVYNAKEKALQDIEDEIATYNSALGYRKSYDYSDIRRKYTNESGKLAVGQLANRDRGRQMYEADRTKALREGGLNADLGDDLSTGRGAHIRYRDSIRDAGYFDTFEDAKHLNEEDRDIFYALYAENPEKAREWLSIAKTERDEQYQAYLSRLVDLRAGEHLGTAGKLADIGAVGAGFVLGTGSNIAAGVTNLIDPYSETALELSRAGQAFLSGGSKMLNREFGTIDEKIPFIGNILGGKGLGDLYQLASSVVQSHLTAGVAANAGELSEAVQALGVVLMGSSAAASDYDESLKRGLTERQARQHAFAAGLNEAAFEWISLDKLVNPDFGASAIKQWLTQSGIEASEEFCTTIANRLTDGMLARRNGYDTQIEQRMKELIARGVDRETAQQQAEHEWTTELINDALGGFLSGGAGQMVNVAANYGMSKFGNVASEIQQLGRNAGRYQEQGAAVSTGEMEAIRAYAKEHDITVQETKAPASETQTKGETEQQAKPGKREQRRRSQRDLSAGIAREETVRNIYNEAKERSGAELQSFYKETVDKYGEGIQSAVREAVTRAASEQMKGIGTLAELDAKQAELTNGVTDQGVLDAVRDAKMVRTMQLVKEHGNEEAAERYIQAVNSMAVKGGAVNLNVSVKAQDGSEQNTAIEAFTKDGTAVKLANGQELTAEQWNSSDVAADADTKNMVNALLSFDFGPAAGTIFNMLDVGMKSGKITDGYRWAVAAGLAFQQGRRGAITKEQAVGRSILDNETAQDLYELGQRTGEKVAGDDQEIVNALVQAFQGKKPNGKIGSIDQTRIQSMLDSKQISDELRQHIVAVNRIAKAAGVNVVWFASGTDENGQYEDMSGKHEDGTIWIDVNSGKEHVGDLSVAILGTMAHELTHFIQDFSPAMYREFKTFALQKIAEQRGNAWLERAIASYVENQGLSESKSEDEIVAQFCQDIFGQKEALQPVLDDLKANHRGIWQKIKEFFAKQLDNISRLLKQNLNRNGNELAVWDELEAEIKRQLASMWGEALADASKAHRVTGEIQNELARDGLIHEITGRDGETVGVQDGKGHVVLQLRSYDESGRAKLVKYLNQAVKDESITAAEAKQIRESVEEMYRVSQEMTKESKGFKDWSAEEVQRALDGKPIFSWMKSNSEYGWSMDASLVCIKRRTLDAVFDHMIRNGLLDNFDMAQQSVVAINDIIRSYGFETACGLCYIDAKRYRAAMVAGSFCDLYNELVRSLVPEGKHLSIGFFNYGQNEHIQDKGKGIDTLPDSELDFRKLKATMHKYGTRTVEYKTAKALMENPSMRKLALTSDFMSSTGFTEIGRLNPLLRKLYNAKKGSGGPKATEADTQYLHDILDKQLSFEKYFNLGGLRVQSFSDYIPRLVFDYVEMIGDMAAKKLPSHAYSKELMFALQFGKTGMKINMSLIPALVDGGTAPGLDANGNYAWRDGQSFGSTVYGLNKEQLDFLGNLLGEKVKDRLTADQGFRLAQKIQNTQGYSQNCGTIAIGVSDKQIEKMLDDPAIRMVIPYHKSGLNHILASLMNVKGFTDYTNYQMTKRWNGENWVNLPKNAKDFNINEYMHKHKVDAKAAADAYLAWCKQKNYKPKFEAFAKHPNYYKVLVDFNCYDAANSEAYAAQQSVKPVFPTDGDAFGSMKDLMRLALKGEDVLKGRQDKSVPQIVKTIEQTLPELEESIRGEKNDDELVRKYEEWRERHNLQQQNRSYLQAVERGDMETAQRMVDEAAKELGYVLSVFHGTAERFNVFRRGLEGIHLGNDRQARQRAKIASEKAENTDYRWSDLRKHVRDFDVDTREKIVDRMWHQSLWIYSLNNVEEFKGDIQNADEVVRYVDNIVKQIPEEDRENAGMIMSTFDRDVSPKVLDLYARINNPLKVDHDILEWTTRHIASMLLEAYNGNGKEFYVGGANHEYVDISSSHIDFTSEEIERLKNLKDIRNDENWDVLADILAAHGYDGIQYVNEYEGDRKSPSYIALHPEDVKLADPVTYYDKERTKPIPLTERFNPKNKDIRFQKRGYRDEGQMGLFGEGGSIQTGMFGNTEAQEGEQTGLFEEKPKQKSSVELFLDSLQAFLEKKKANHDVWYGKEFDAFYEEHPEINFVKRFMDNDPKVKADLQAFAASIDDENVLSDLSWYTTQSPSISKKPGYRGALTKVRNVYKNRISEIAAEKNNGRVYKLERKAYDAKEIRRIFDELNTNKALSKLADKVFSTTRNLGLQFYATNRILGKQQAEVGGTNAGKNIWLRINTFADKALSDQYKASVILHEMIHACTNYAFSSDYKRSPYQDERIINAVNAMEAIYRQAKYEKSLQGEYGLKEIREFTAELANPVFREKLEKVSLLERAINAIKRFFGIEKSNALDSASTALDYLLDNIDMEGVREYQRGVERDIERWERQNNMSRYQMRSYDLPSDLELMDNAAESLSEAGGEEYWNALLESAPELASDKAEIQSLAKAYREQAKKLAEAEKNLAEAKRNLTTTDRKLRTRGIAGMTLEIMKSLEAGDVKGRHVAQRVTEIITNGYQKGLDAIDAGKDAGEVWNVVWNEGVEKAADYLLENATHSEKFSYGWTTVFLNKFMPGEDGRWAVLDAISAKVVQDWNQNRMREPIQETAADRIVQRVEGRMQKQINEQTERADTAEAKVNRLQEDVNIWKDAQVKASDAALRLQERLDEVKAELKQAKGLTTKEQKAKRQQAVRLNNRLQAKRQEAAAWKKLAERNEALLNAALKSKNADIDALRVQMDRNATEAEKKQAALVQKLADQVKREQDILSGKLKPLAMQRLLRAERERAAKKAEQHKDEVFQNYKERKNQAAIRNRIKNLHAEMERDLLRPREGHFVPETLIRPVVELLDMVNTQTNRAKSESAQAKIDAINAQYDKLKNDERYSMYYDETVKALLVELSATLDGRNIYQLNSDELADVYTAMKAMRTTIRNAIRADLIEKGKEIFEVGNELRQELRQGKGAHAYLLEKYHMSMLNAQRAFNRFGGYRQDSTWNKVYKMLDDAQLDMLRIEMEATRIFDPVLKAKEDFEKAQNLTSMEKGALVDVGLRDENGRSVWITRGMMLSLYMHLQNEQNMKHVMYGGLTLPDFKRYYNGNPEAWGRGTVEIPALGARVSNLDQLLEEQGEAWVRSQYKTMEEDIKKMFESVRESIEKQMTDYDRKWIAASKDFFDNFSRLELNRVTNSMYGFSKAKVDNYFPIVTDSNFLKSEFDSISRNVSLENAGFMKERVKASNPILLEDITRTVNRQISNVSRYAGLTQALKQFGNVYNVQTKGFTDSVKKAMAKSYGKTGQEYIQNLITDMVGGRSTPGTIFDRIKGNYAQAVLSANLSVTIKQAASYPTAAAVVGWKPLMKALTKGGKNGRLISRADRALIDAYSPLLWKRSQGAIDTEIGDMAHAQDWTKKAKWLMGWIEKTDIATVGRLWYAAEYYVQDNFKGLEKGTAEQIRNGESKYYRKVAEVFNRIVEETQPNYTVLQRPDILRNPNKLVRSLVMFSTQRFQNGQILMDAAAEYGAMRTLDRNGSTEETKAARQEAKRKLTWAITSQAVSAVVLNAMTLLAGALMHRMNPWRDDDDEITLESTAGALLDGWVESLAGSFLGGSEIYEALDSLLTGSTYYGNDVGGLSSINDFASALITMGQKAIKLVGDDNSRPEDWANLAKNQLWKVGEYLSQMTGVPVANVRKIIEGGVQHVQDAMETHLFSYEAGLSRSNTANARRYAEAWEAGDGAKMQAVIDEMNRNLEKASKSTDGARDAITKAAKERYEAGEIKLDQYADFLRKAGYLEEDKIESKIRDFLRDELVSGDRTEEEVLRLLTELGGLTEDKAWKKVMEWKAKAETGNGEDGDEAAKYSEYDALREDLRGGTSFHEAAADYLAHGYTEKQVRDAAKEDLKARFQSGEINEDEAIDLLAEYSGKDEDACWKTVQGWQGAMEHPDEEDYSWGQYDAIDEAIDASKDIKALAKELTAHGVEEKNITNHVKAYLVERYVDGKATETQLKNQLSRYLGIVAKADVDKILKDANSKKLYGVAYSSLDEEYRAGNIGKAELRQALMKQGGLSGAEADLKIRWYDLQKSNPNLEISESRANSWYDGTSYTKTNGHESAKTAGMSISDYLRAKDELAKVSGVDANGDGRTDTGSREIAFIRALTAMSWLTDRQRRALYYEEYKGTSKTSSRPF